MTMFECFKLIFWHIAPLRYIWKMEWVPFLRNCGSCLHQSAALLCAPLPPLSISANVCWISVRDTPLPPTIITISIANTANTHIQVLFMNIHTVLCFLLQCSHRLCIKFLIDPSGVGFSQLGEIYVHNGMNLDLVISKRAQCFWIPSTRQH